MSFPAALTVAQEVQHDSVMWYACLVTSLDARKQIKDIADEPHWE